MAWETLSVGAEKHGKSTCVETKVVLFCLSFQFFTCINQRPAARSVTTLIRLFASRCQAIAVLSGHALLVVSDY